MAYNGEYDLTVAFGAGNALSYTDDNIEGGTIWSGTGFKPVSVDSTAGTLKASFLNSALVKMTNTLLSLEANVTALHDALVASGLIADNDGELEAQAVLGSDGSWSAAS